MMASGNYVSRLNEYAQKMRLNLHFEDLGSVGLDHNKTFSQRVAINGEKYPTGEGKTKKDAKQSAARNALEELMGSEDQDRSDSPRKAAEASASPLRQTNTSNLNYICWLNEHGQKTGQTVKPLESTKPGPNSTAYVCSFKVGDTEYPAVTETSKRKAKEEAARLVYDIINGSEGTQSSWKSTPASTNGSEIHDESSGSPMAQRSTRSTVSECNTSTRGSNASPQNASTHSTSSGIWTDSSSFSEDQSDARGNSLSTHQNQARFTMDFDPLECLGSGAYGSVYKARHKLLKKDYAVKIVCCEEKSLREVQTLSDLLHKNIVRYYTFWMQDSRYEGDLSNNSCSSTQSADNSAATYLYIQMELCDTKTLKDWISEKNSQSLQNSKRGKESLGIFQQVLNGVEYIHSKKHIHRDLKPANILFGLDGQVKIGDFGLVTRDDDDALIDRTVNQGTPTYMAPEQKRNNKYDRKVDIFPLGLIFLELLWKVSSGHERGDLLLKARQRRFPEKFSLEFHREKKIIKKMLSEEPEGRPDARELLEEVKLWSHSLNKQDMDPGNRTV